jgi:hypothetical protein
MKNKVSPVSKEPGPVHWDGAMGQWARLVGMLREDDR